MTVKLNLTIDQQLVKKIKAYAEKRKISVSKLVEQLLSSEIEPFENQAGFTERYAGKLNGRLSEETVEAVEKTKASKYGY